MNVGIQFQEIGASAFRPIPDPQPFNGHRVQLEKISS